MLKFIAPCDRSTHACPPATNSWRGSVSKLRTERTNGDAVHEHSRATSGSTDHHRSSTLALCAALAGAMLVGGCDGGGGGGGARIGDKTPQQTSLPAVQVKLPPSPSFKKEHAPEHYPDQSLSVYGVRKNMKATLNKQVRIKGFITEVYECPPCPKGSTCPPCQKPHFWLADRANAPKDKALMVTDYPAEDEKKHGRHKKPKMKFNVGAQYFVSGTFAKSSATGFSSSEGLLVFAEAAEVKVE